MTDEFLAEKRLLALESRVRYLENTVKALERHANLMIKDAEASYCGLCNNYHPYDQPHRWPEVE